MPLPNSGTALFAGSGQEFLRAGLEGSYTGGSRRQRLCRGDSYLARIN